MQREWSDWHEKTVCLLEGTPRARVNSFSMPIEIDLLLENCAKSRGNPRLIAALLHFFEILDLTFPGLPLVFLSHDRIHERFCRILQDHVQKILLITRHVMAKDGCDLLNAEVKVSTRLPAEKASVAILLNRNNIG